MAAFFILYNINYQEIIRESACRLKHLLCIRTWINPIDYFCNFSIRLSDIISDGKIYKKGS